MSDSEDPIMLNLAQLSREKLGPFLLLGLSKKASKKDIERHWAERLKWARKNAINIILEDVNWAREMLAEPEQRVLADVESLTADLTDCPLEAIADRYNVEESSAPAWEPLDDEKDLQDYEPAVDVPDLEVVKGQIVLPEIPEEMLSVHQFLEPLRVAELDPWQIELST